MGVVSDTCYKHNSRSTASCYSHESMVRGYHIYKKIWEAVDREVLHCKRERNNRHDPFAVAITYQGQHHNNFLETHVFTCCY